MAETSQVYGPAVSPAESNRWIGRLLIAVVLGAALWNFVVSLTENVVVPALARVTEADSQSPLYLGNGNYHIGALLISILELCLAGIVSAIISSASRRAPKFRKKVVRAAVPAEVSFIPAESKPIPSIPAPPPVQPVPVIAPPPAKSAKPKPPKEVAYNLVGEPVDPEE